MIIEQFYDKGLAHGSYAIISENQMAVIDPARDPQPYIDFAKKHDARIVAIFETHPHADFVSSHLELHELCGATIYVSKLLGADYPHQTFDEGDSLQLGKVRLEAINTPGHSPDSICILAYDENGRAHALFSGDTLFVGDVGRPDLREEVGNLTAKKEELAGQMYRSTREKLMVLPEDVLVYPAHGPGSLCGKNMSPDLFSTIGRELKENYALQPMDKDRFVQLLTEDQPFVPKYFGHDVMLNKSGAPGYSSSVSAVPKPGAIKPEPGVLIIDARPEKEFKKGHYQGSINLQDGLKFETWLGAIVNPGEPFYLLAEADKLDLLIQKAAKIGYERQIKAAITADGDLEAQTPAFDLEAFEQNPEAYTIVDIRNHNEVKEGKVFANALTIPLHELRERAREVPLDKPIVVHCAAGYRSAAGASILEQQITNTPVLDMSDAINRFKKGH